MEGKIGPGWSGIVTREVIEPLAQAIEQQFGDKQFSTMSQNWIEDSPFPQRKEAIADIHCRLDKIRPMLPDTIYIIVRNQWSIQTGSFVCLSQRCLLVESVRASGHDVWCWVLEG